MTKQMNTRAHKRALKKSYRKSHRNLSGKEAKRLAKKQNESFENQLKIFTDAILDKITRLKNKLNMIKANFKFMFNNSKEEKANDLTLNDMIKSFATRENISFALATVILLNCFGSLNISAFAAEEPKAKNNKSNVENIEEFLNLHSDLVEDLLNLQSSEIDDDKEASSSLVPKELYDGVVEQLFDESIVTVKSSRELTNEEKIAIILDKYDITEDQFYYIVALVLLEGGENHYEECYNVTSSLYNRISSDSCIIFVNNKMGENAGISLYNQAICPGQYTVSKDEIYRLMQQDLSVYEGYQAVIDMFFSEEPSHNYYRFVDSSINHNYGGTQLYPRGNCYFAEVTDRIDLADVLPNYSKYHAEDEEIEPESEDKIDSETITRGKVLILEPNKKI